MPREWGSWSATSDTGARYRVGMDWSRSGTQVTVHEFVFESAYSIYKDVRLRGTGQFGGDFEVYVGTSGGVVSLGHGGTAYGNRGGSVTVGGRVTDILHGLTCDVSLTVQIPALPPSAPGNLRITSRGATWVRGTWDQPATNGAPIIEYQTSINGTFYTSQDRELYFTGLTPNSSNFVNVRARNSAGWGPWAGREYFTTDMLDPFMPDVRDLTYYDDSTIRIRWYNNATSERPYDRLQIQYRYWVGWYPDGGTTEWYYFVGKDGGASSHTSQNRNPNQWYAFRIRAGNDSGWSSYRYLGPIATTPGPAVGLEAGKQTGGDIALSWSSRHRMPITRWEIEDDPDGTGWVAAGTAAAGARSWSHLSPDPAVTHSYRVRPVLEQDGDTLAGDWSEASNTVQLQAPPLAPTLVSPEDGAVLPNDQGVELSWQHEPVDTSGQEAWELRWRPDGGTWTVESGTTAQSHLLPVQPSGVYEWQVRTRGADPEFGPWSSLSVFTTASVPQVVIQSPAGGTLAAAHVAVDWSYSDADGSAQATWQTELLDAEGQVLERGSGSGAASTHEFDTRLGDATEYTIRVRVRSGAGLWSDWDETTFTTSFPLPATITPGLEWDRSTAAVSVSLATEHIPDRTYAWTGTPGASTSTESVDGVVVWESLVTNPSFEHGTAGWSTVSGLTLERAQSGAAGAEGSWVGELVPNGSGAPTSILAWTTMPVAGSVISVLGRTVRANADVPPDVRLMVRAYDGGGGNLGDIVEISVSTLAGPEGSMNEALAEGVPLPSGAVSVRLAWYLPTGYDASGWTSGSLQIDAHMLVQGATLPPEGYFDGDTADVAAPDAVDVERRDAGGEWVLIGSGLDPYTSITDPTPRLGEVEYRVTSRTVLPSEAVGPVGIATWERRHGGPSVYVTGGEDMSMVCTAQGGARSNSPLVEQSAVRFAGQSHPTAQFGTGQEYEIGFAGRIIHTANHGVSLREDWEALLRQFSVVCYRDTTGEKVYGLLSASFSLDRVVEQVDIAVQRTRYVEGVERMDYIVEGD